MVAKRTTRRRRIHAVPRYDNQRISGQEKLEVSSDQDSSPSQQTSKRTIIRTSSTNSKMQSSSADNSMSSLTRSAGTTGSTSQVNLSYLLCFTNIFQLPEFSKVFNYRDMQYNDDMEWIIDNGRKGTGGSDVQTIMDLTKAKLEKGAKMKRLGNEDSEEISEISILKSAHIRQIYRVSLAIHSYGVRDARIRQIFQYCYNDDKISQRYLVGSAYLTNILGSTKASKSYSKSSELQLATASNIEVLLYFHCVRIVMRLKNELKLSHKTGTRIGYAVQTICKCWVRLIQLIKNHRFGLLSAFIMPYIIFDHDRRMFRVLKSRAEGFSNALQEQSLENVFVTNEQIHVSAIAWNRNVELDSALRQIVDLLFVNLESIVSNLYLYHSTERELKSWRTMRQYQFASGDSNLPPIFSTLPDNICQILGVVKPPSLVDDDEHNNGMEVVHVPVNNMFSPTKSLGKKRGRDEVSTADEPGKKRNKAYSDEDDEIKTEPLNTTIKPGRSLHLSKEADEAYDKLVLKNFCVLDVGFEDLESAALDQGIELSENVDLLITAPPQKSMNNEKNEEGGTVANRAQMEEEIVDSISVQDMDKFADFCCTVIKPGGHGIIFCSHLQFHIWFYKLLSKNENVPDLEADPNGNVKKIEKVFHVEPVPLTFVKSSSAYPTPDKKDLRHSNIVQLAIHFWRKGIPQQDALKKVNYDTAPSLPSPYPAWTNVLSAVPPLQKEEIVYVEVDNYGGNTTSTTKEMLREDQIPIGLIQELTKKFSRKGDLVLDPFSGTFSVFKACMLLDEHRRCIGGDIDEECVLHCESILIEIYARQLLNTSSDLNTSDETQLQSARALFSELERLKIKKRASAWDVPTGLSAVQNFPPYIVQYLCTFHKDMSLFEKGVATPMLQWSSEWNRRLNEMDPNVLLAHECTQRNIFIKKSLINSPLSGLGVFAGKTFAEGDIIGFYYGGIVYGDIGKKVMLSRTYGEGVLAVNPSQFNKWSISIRHEFISTNGDKFCGWIFPAPFCASRYINDARYHESDKSTPDERKKNPRTSNVEFVVDRKARLNRDFERYNVVSIKTTRTVKVGEELYMDYGIDYNFEI